MLPTTYSFFTGALAALYAVAGMFFLSFWRRTRDALFASFALAFALLATNQIVLAFGGLEREERSWVYVLRLLAFLLIIAGIARKNLEGRRR